LDLSADRKADEYYFSTEVLILGWLSLY